LSSRARNLSANRRIDSRHALVRFGDYLRTEPHLNAPFITVLNTQRVNPRLYLRARR